LIRLAGSGWDAAGEVTLRTATLALVHLTAEYCASVWCGSAHTRLIDLAINDTLQAVPGCLRPTPADNLPILAGIQPAELRHKRATLSLSMPCHGGWTSAPLSAHLSIEWECTASQIETPIHGRWRGDRVFGHP